MGIKVICATNFTYGMTGGQNAPTTPHGAFSTSYPWGGNPEDSIDVSKLAVVGGAPFVARWTTYHPQRATRSITKALSKDGFCFVEMLSPCPTNFGRRNEKPSIQAMEGWIKERTQIVAKSFKDQPSCEELEYFVFTKDKKFPLGEFQDTERVTFQEKWKETCTNAKAQYLKLKKRGKAT